MQIFRKHVMMWLVNLVLAMGIMASSALPFSSNAQKTAFTQWLDRNVVAGTGETSEVRAHIRQLPVQNIHFSLLLEKASMLVVNHKNDFNLPLEQDEADAGMVELWLVDKWSQHQNEAGSMDALIPEILKPGAKWQAQNQPPTGFAKSIIRHLYSDKPGTTEEIIHISGKKPVPFLSGSTINAP